MALFGMPRDDKLIGFECLIEAGEDLSAATRARPIRYLYRTRDFMESVCVAPGSRRGDENSSIVRTRVASWRRKAGSWGGEMPKACHVVFNAKWVVIWHGKSVSKCPVLFRRLSANCGGIVR